MKGHYSWLSLGSMDNIGYLLDDGEGHRALIDAAAEPERLLDWIGDDPLDVIVTTHQHADHVAALAAVAQATGATNYAGAPDAASIERQTGVHCNPVWTGDHIPVGSLSLEVIGLVGHTPGSIALVWHDSPVLLFTGDSLFPGGVGKTNSATEFTSLLDDVTTKIFDRFADDTLVLPGHGLPTTLGAERPHLDEWRQRGW
ncbi:MBL fold metallo-hydrolase [Propionibacterium sp.]|uniref:MBL fold metallo-hydrolase n=1 Tax=Propionibacterium sp. TaxID=1977903 RepID=UPI0039ECA61F